MERLHRRAIRKYQQDGFVSLAQAGSRKIYRDISEIIIERPIEQRLRFSGLIDTNDLHKRSSQTLTYAPASQVCIPQITPSITPSLNKHVGEYRASSLQLFVLEDCIVSDKGVITTAEENIVLESTRSELYRLVDLVKDNTEQLSDWLQFYLNPVEHITRNENKLTEFDLAMPLIPYNGWERNYYHWILEILPQVRAFETYSQVIGEVPLIILPPNPPNFATELLSLTGIQSDQWVKLSSESASIRRVVLPETRYWSGSEYNPTQSELDWLRDRLRANVDTTKSPFSPNIYISRNDADCRDVENEKEVMGVLDKFGFEKYILSEHTAEEQIQMFSNANHVVAPHGAGLVNIMFGDDIETLEFLARSSQRPFFYYLSGLLGHDYEYILCNQENKNYNVNIEKLYNRLHRIER